MKWFFKWLYKKIDSSRDDLVVQDKQGILGHPRNFSEIGMDFTVYRANGGTLIETRMYDRKTDRNSTGLHIITDEKDLGEEIAKIITYERIRS